MRPPDRHQPADGAEHRRLAGTGLSDDPERFVPGEREAGADHRFDPACAIPEDDMQIVDLQLGTGAAFDSEHADAQAGLCSRTGTSRTTLNLIEASRAPATLTEARDDFRVPVQGPA